MDEHEDRDDFSCCPMDQPQRSQDTMALLRRELDAAFGAGAELTRNTALQLLRIISETLGPSLRIAVEEADPDVVYVTDHPGIELLNELRDAIADLENAKHHPALEKAKEGKNASDSSQQARRNQGLLELVEVVRMAEGHTTRKEAQESVAKKIPSSITTRRGEKITGKKLKEMRDHACARMKGRNKVTHE